MDIGSDLVLVTGALGWLGINLVDALVNGLEDCNALSQPSRNLRVRCLILPGQDDSVLKRMSERIEVVTGDLRNRKDCARFCDGAQELSFYILRASFTLKELQSFIRLTYREPKIF